MTEQIMRYAIIGVLSQVSYLAVWSIADRLGVPRAEFGGCGLPSKWADVIDQLVADGVIEEAPDLGCRYSLVKEK